MTSSTHSIIYRYIQNYEIQLRCLRNPDDNNRCFIHIDCAKKEGFTLRAIENGKCVYDPIKCKQGEQLVNNKCISCPRTEKGLYTLCPPIVCNTGEHYNPVQKRCVPDDCPKGQHFDDKLNKCIPNVPICPKGQHYDNNQKKCIPDCPKDQRFDPNVNKCVPICPPGFHLEKGVCTKNIVIKVPKVETVVKNLVTSQPTFLLLLDTTQLCQIAGNTQCVAQQNQFNTLNLVTKLDPATKTWTITGQVANRVAKVQRNVQVIANFYDSKGNSVGGPYKGTINPTVLKSRQLGTFSMKPSTSIMKGTPSFIRLEYQSTAAAS